MSASTTTCSRRRRPGPRSTAPSVTSCGRSWAARPRSCTCRAVTGWMTSRWSRRARSRWSASTTAQVAAGAAQRRADELGAACRYVVGAVPGVPLADASADLVYTGKGALIWMPDLTAWAREAARLLRPGGHLFVYEAHPAVPLWTWDEDQPRIREDRSYFARSHVNDTFPARGAVEWQWTLGQVVTAVAAAGMEIAAPRRVPGAVLAARRCLARRPGTGACRTPSPCSPAGNGDRSLLKQFPAPAHRPATTSSGRPRGLQRQPVASPSRGADEFQSRRWSDS